jgi:hypothetical protein
MIPEQKIQNALRALNHVLVVTRQMAHSGDAHTEIADALDIIEYLPRLLAAAEDRTDLFRRYLADLETRWPQFGPAVQYFDDPSLSLPW